MQRRRPHGQDVQTAAKPERLNIVTYRRLNMDGPPMRKGGNLQLSRFKEQFWSFGFGSGVEKRPTPEPTGIMKTLNVRQRHIHTFLNTINNNTLDPRRVVFLLAPRPSRNTANTTFTGPCPSLSSFVAEPLLEIAYYQPQSQI